ncbi:hypothetical protein Trydic_g17664 [Trypoxylus dichotomus]
MRAHSGIQYDPQVFSLRSPGDDASLEDKFGWVAAPSSSETASREKHGRAFPWMDGYFPLCIPGPQSVEGCLQMAVDYPGVMGFCEDANVIQVDVRGCWNVARLNAEQDE